MFRDQLPGRREKKPPVPFKKTRCCIIRFLKTFLFPS
jgi:hypothetical protein